MDKGRLKWTEKYIKHLAKLITHTLWLRLCFYPHYTYENTEAQGAEITPKAFFHGSTGIQIQVYMTPHLLQNHTVCILWEKVTSILAFEYCFLNLEKPLCICYPRAFFFFFFPNIWDVPFLNLLKLLQQDASVVNISLLGHKWLAFPRNLTVDKRYTFKLQDWRLNKVVTEDRFEVNKCCC